MTSIAFIGNATSMSYLLGRELISRGYDVDIVGNSSIFQTNKLGKNTKPSLAHRALRKYAKPLYRETLNKKEYDIEIRSFSLPIVKAKHRIVFYHGNDLRDHSFPVEYPCFYSTKDLGMRYLDSEKVGSGNAVWIPRCFVDEYFHPLERLPFENNSVVIGHLPTDPKMKEKGLAHKGSDLFYSAIKSLKDSGYKVKLVTPDTIGHLPHDQMIKFYEQVHVVADQFSVGQYGVTALEAICCNRPVVCYVDSDYWEFKEMHEQIVNCSPMPTSIAMALRLAISHNVDPQVVKQCYNPKRSVDMMEKALQSWGFLN